MVGAEHNRPPRLRCRLEQRAYQNAVGVLGMTGSREIPRWKVQVLGANEERIGAVVGSRPRRLS